MHKPLPFGEGFPNVDRLIRSTYREQLDGPERIPTDEWEEVAAAAAGELAIPRNELMRRLYRPILQRSPAP